MSATNGANRAAAVLTCLVGALIVILATVTVVQFRWTNQLQQQYEESRLELMSLQTSCLDNTHPDASLELIRAAILKNLETVGNYVEPKRERRQAGGSLEQMLTEMMVAQEKVLMSHCLNSSKLCIPGQKGDPGMKGDTGPPGKIGLPGKTGKQGPMGDIGPHGINGSKGEIGPQGLPGVNGTQGPIGLQGLKGDPGVSGAKGLPGKLGPTGIDGQKGDKGVAGLVGPMGNNGTVGQKGEKGDRGLNGTKGAVGPQGPVGSSAAALRKDCACIIRPKIDVFRPNETTATYSIGSRVDLYCNASSSPNTVVTWSGPLGGCVPASVSGGTVHIPSLQPSQIGTYTCTATNSFGTVSKSVTIQSNTSGALDCDFEAGKTCLWTSGKKGDLDWKRYSGYTPTSSTGPNNDHTIGTASGHYMYMETSNGRQGSFAEFVSPDLGNTPGMCLSFWYNMNGRDEGAINVEDQTCNTTSPNSIRLHIAGNQGIDWHMAQIQLRSVPNTHRIIIKGFRGSGILSDIAVDDIEYYPGRCKTTLSRTLGSANQAININTNASLSLDCGISGTPPPVYHWKKIGGCPINATTHTLKVTSRASSGDGGVYECTATGSSKSLTTTFNVTVNGPTVETCTLEDGWCGWTQSSAGDDFDWTRYAGETSSKDTGPTVDHTLKNVNGHYAFIEASSPRVLNDAAILTSHMLRGGRTACFTFSYHMYGSDTGNLKVIVEDACNHRQSLVFNMSGDKGQSWITKSIPIPLSAVPHDYRILVKAEVGSSYHSDIAIDDLSIKDGQCT